jgi:hypothetical protein
MDCLASPKDNPEKGAPLIALFQKKKEQGG